MAHGGSISSELPYCTMGHGIVKNRACGSVSHAGSSSVRRRTSIPYSVGRRPPLSALRGCSRPSVEKVLNPGSFPLPKSGEIDLSNLMGKLLLGTILGRDVWHHRCWQAGPSTSISPTRLVKGNSNLGPKSMELPYVVGLFQISVFQILSMNMYCKSGHFGIALRIFENLHHPDIVSWNTVLSGFEKRYAQEGDNRLEAVLTFINMMRDGMLPDHVSLTGAVSACGHERNLELGRQCEVMRDAKLVFQLMNNRNVVSWTIISIDEDAISRFNEMRIDNVYPNEVTFIGLIHAITTQNLLKEGLIMVHGLCIKGNFLSESTVCNSLITIMFKESFLTFLSALKEITPNQYTFGSVLNAIGAAEDISIKHGQRCHSTLIKLGLSTDPIISGALLDMYAKRGSIIESLQVFSETPERTQFAWTAIISAYSRHGDYKSVMRLFKRMEMEKKTPDSITFLSVLTACCRNGMVDVGLEVFDSMIKDHHIEPNPEHYFCNGRHAGPCREAKGGRRADESDSRRTWIERTAKFAWSCRLHGNIEIAEKVVDILIEMEPTCSGSYVLMSNLYAEKGKWERKWLK
ncbi:pentatricopeptide repeat-containing protein At4g32430, mitochondrial-like [Prosopis cineraria]|uniref:pentatricopeptide repeat-containing protein At4g32430, mitochondrial-like n=1 Tax=Prosopis cineraria TaxID=364024 RepID=UPI00240FFE58|nr:pentatricopeptide repeat-containing protein At4g32430, mitochondrial-like [Prosopis cineraria]